MPLPSKGVRREFKSPHRHFIILQVVPKKMSNLTEMLHRFSRNTMQTWRDFLDVTWSTVLIEPVIEYRDVQGTEYARYEHWIVMRSRRRIVPLFTEGYTSLGERVLTVESPKYFGIDTPMDQIE